MASTPGETPILQTVEISRAFGGFRAVDGASISIGRGDVVALIGPNGAGKTTLFNVISRLLPPTSGQLLFEGADVTHTSPQRLARMGIGRT
ncbi:MAG: ATP-binding cassette domain-containing protein, partial [Solirubrobacterales bacterium]|nr:ATP-binding cassette domain-containing protein [Solirubrobacterales bacterium]